MRKTFMALLAATLILSLFLGACSSPATTNPAAAKTTAPAATTAALAATTSAPPSTTAAATTSPVASGPIVTLKLGASLGTASGQTKLVQWWADEVTKRSNGRIKFQTFWGGTLVQRGEELNAVQKGILDAGIIVSIYNPDELPLFGWDYNFMFSPTDPDMAGKLAAKVMARQEVRDSIEKYNMKILGQVFLAPYGYNGTKPFNTYTDLKGIKIATSGQEMGSWVSAVGAVPVTMGSGDKYGALQTGVVTGNLLSTDSIYSNKLHEVAKYVTLCELGSPIGSALTINKDSFNKLPTDLQKVLIDVGSEMLDQNITAVKAAYDTAITKMKAEGATIIPFSFEEKVKWANAVPNLPSDWAKKADAKGLAGTTLVNYYLDAAKEMGYKWPREWRVEK